MSDSAAMNLIVIPSDDHIQKAMNLGIDIKDVLAGVVTFSGAGSVVCSQTESGYVISVSGNVTNIAADHENESLGIFDFLNDDQDSEFDSLAKQIAGLVQNEVDKS